jgi:hypothetical protein
MMKCRGGVRAGAQAPYEREISIEFFEIQIILKINNAGPVTF